jgi:hypothetical protein
MAAARGQQWQRQQRQRWLTETAEGGCGRRLWTTRMAAPLWKMVAVVEAATAEAAAAVEAGAAAEEAGAAVVVCVTTSS